MILVSLIKIELDSLLWQLVHLIKQSDWFLLIEKWNEFQSKLYQKFLLRYALSIWDHSIYTSDLKMEFKFEQQLIISQVPWVINEQNSLEIKACSFKESTNHHLSLSVTESGTDTNTTKPTSYLLSATMSFRNAQTLISSKMKLQLWVVTQFESSKSIYMAIVHLTIT